MGFFDKIKKIINNDLMAFIKEKRSKNDSQFDLGNQSSDIVYKGAWEEDGQVKWGQFNMEEKEAASSSIDTDKELEDISSKKQYPVSSESELPEKNKKKEEIKKAARVTVFCVEDDLNLQAVLKKFLLELEQIELIGFADDGIDALLKFRNMKNFPDVVLMDIAMPNMDGIEAVEKIIKINPSQKIIMLTCFGDKNNVLASFAAGAVGYLRKDIGLSVLEDAIVRASRGEAPYMEDKIASYLVDGIEGPF